MTGSPQLALSVGTYTRQATYIGKTGSSSLVFGYTVQAVDTDTDGISVTANSLTLNGSTIRDVDSNNATLGLGTHAITNDAARKVNGNTDNAPTVRGVVLNSTPKSGDTYGTGENIWIGVEFYEAATTTGTPQLALSIGTYTRQANYSYSDLGRRWLFFVYTTQAVDTDTDGVSIAANALTLNSGTIQDSGSNAAMLSLSGHTITNAAAHKVDGSIDRAPIVTNVAVYGPRSGDTFGARETIRVEVVFDEAVTVTGTPQLALTIGTFTRPASYVSYEDYISSTGDVSAYFRSSDERYVYFLYTVQASDLDVDGISIAANALTLNGGTIRDAGGNAATLDLSNWTFTNTAGLKVDGRVDNLPQPNSVLYVRVLPPAERRYLRTRGEDLRKGRVP